MKDIPRFPANHLFRKPSMVSLWRPQITSHTNRRIIGGGLVGFPTVHCLREWAEPPSRYRSTQWTVFTIQLYSDRDNLSRTRRGQTKLDGERRVWFRSVSFVECGVCIAICGSGLCIRPTGWLLQRFPMQSFRQNCGSQREGRLNWWTPQPTMHDISHKPGTVGLLESLRPFGCSFPSALRKIVALTVIWLLVGRPFSDCGGMKKIGILRSLE